VKPEEVRSQFIEFFEKRGHTFVPSSPLILPDDPTLLFANAGMNQFKDVFLGTGKREYSRAVNSQKCIRVSGKHNDLEEVGRDTYHHTFFEMLGNWSFGDYFKAEAITWAWELLTDVWRLPKHRLYVTVFGRDEQDNIPADDEAEKLWRDLTDVDPSHISRWGRKDNFWEAGETGPCGPNSEIHIDLTPDASGGNLVNADSPAVVELWNLVFIQFNRASDGSLGHLPARHVDTGLGFDRICVVLKHLEALRENRKFTFSNYGTELFVPLIKQIEELSGHVYGSRSTGGKGFDRYDASDMDDLADVACRVIADHARMLTFAITDGALPSNEGRGYVVRRILRRAARFGRQHLELGEPFIHQLVDIISEVMGPAFPEIRGQQARVAELIRDEEVSFGRTLDRGIQLFNQAANRAATDDRRTISADDAFRLYDTYGFPLDLTVQMAEERQLNVDGAGFDELMAQARERARAGVRNHVAIAFEGELPGTADHFKYLGRDCRGRVQAWVLQNRLIADGKLEPGNEVGLLLDQTCFYAEQGGQVGDVGTIATETGLFTVSTTQKLGDGIVHIGQVSRGYIEPGQTAQLRVDESRERTRCNHTVTHLLHLALRQVLGEHVTQRGSLVEPARFRFDFDHNSQLSEEELARVEGTVNRLVWEDYPVRWYEKPQEEAMRLPGVRAFFGEKYGQVVRVVEIGDGISRELCGGTHVESTGRIGLFRIASEEAIARGVRRITGVTGPAALEYTRRLEKAARLAAGQLNAGIEDLPERVAGIQEELRQVRRQLQRGQAADLKTVREQLLEAAERVQGHAVVIGEVPSVPVEQIRDSIDWLRSKAASAVVVLGCRQGEGKALLLVGVSADLVDRGLHAGDMIKHLAPIVGGRGGGKPQLAQAGGKDSRRLEEALAEARQLVRSRLEEGS
jgi:alanyl-tRNA synthetase